MASIGWAAALLAVPLGMAGALRNGPPATGSSPLATPAGRRAQELTLRGPEPAVIELGGEAVVTLSLDGAEGEAELVAPAAIPGLEVRVGARERSSYQTVTATGVEVRARTTWRVSLVPANEGRFEIPPFEARYAEGVGRPARSGEARFRSRGATLECVREFEGERYAFVELEPSSAGAFVRQRIGIVLRWGLDEDFVDSNLLQLFARELDVPVQIEASWVDELPGAERLEGPDPPADGPTFALGERILRARPGAARERDGRRFAVWELETSWIPTRSGELVVPAPLVRFAWASRFDSDLVAGARPLDRRIAHVRGEPLRIEIAPLPERDRPSGFAGAVGRFGVSASASPTELAAGESAKLELRIRGEGALDGFPPPRPAFEGFDVRGELDSIEGAERIVTYDLAPRSETVTRIPAVPFSFFDPSDPPGYRTEWTEPIALTVRPRAAERAARGLDPEPDTPSPAEGPGPERRSKLVLVAGGVAIAWIVLLRHARRRRTLREHDRARPSEAALRMREALDRGEVDAAAALSSYLATRLGCAPAAVIAPDLPRRLEAASIGADVARRTARALEHLVAARYGEAPRVERAELEEIVRQLEAAWPSSQP